MNGVDQSGGSVPTVFIGIPMAVGVRDILRSGAFDALKRGGVRIHLFTRAAHVDDFKNEFQGPDVHVHPLEEPSGGLFRFVDRVILRFYVLLLSCRCDTARIMVDARLRQSVWARGLRSLLAALGPRAGARMVGWTRWLTLNFGPDLYGDAMRRWNPDLVIGTRVLTMTTAKGRAAAPYLDRYLIISGHKHGVETMVLIPSWDNLTSKGFFPVEPDLITVWNETMRREAVELHDLPEDAVAVTGAPQHDVYAGAPFTSRSDFCRDVGLDPERPFVVYATQTEGTIPDEPELARQLHEAIRRRFSDALQLVVRLHQLDRPERYGELRGLPGLAVDLAGDGYLGDYPDRVFDRAASERLADTLFHAGVVISTASSISIDASAVGTPVVGVYFDALGERTYDRSVRRYYDFTHQANLVRSDGLRLATDMESLLDAIEDYLEDPTLDADARARLVAEQCHVVDGHSGRRVGELILRVLGVPERLETPPLQPA